MNGQRQLPSNSGTHVEDEKDLVEIRLPAGDRVFVALRVEKPGDYILFALLGDPPLDLC